MHNRCTYQIEIWGQVEEQLLNATSPLQMRLVRIEADQEHGLAVTLFTVCADQSGLIGLLRHLHGHGFVIWSVYRQK